MLTFAIACEFVAVKIPVQSSGQAQIDVTSGGALSQMLSLTNDASCYLYLIILLVSLKYLVLGVPHNIKHYGMKLNYFILSSGFFFYR